MTAQQNAPVPDPPGGIEGLAHAYYVRVPPDELAEQGEEHTRAVVVEHASLGAKRRPGQTLARTYVPAGGTGGRAVLDVVTDDMPFLVDSLTALVSRQGCAIRWL